MASYDKKSYRESKRRRKQAMRQSETGIIKPYRRSKKPLFLLLGAAVLCVALAAGFILFRTETVRQETYRQSLRILSDAERLRPVNRSNPMDKDEVPPLTDFDGVKVHFAVADSLRELCDAAKAQGITLTVMRGYVSFEEQKKLYEDNLALFVKNPAYTQVRAQAAAQRVVPEAGCSEAQTGLYVEFDLSQPRAKAFAERACIHYGFIRRYEKNKEDITHMQANDAAYRYVGKEDAAKMRAFDMCLEEYKEYVDSQTIVTIYE